MKKLLAVSFLCLVSASAVAAPPAHAQDGGLPACSADLDLAVEDLDTAVDMVVDVAADLVEVQFELDVANAMLDVLGDDANPDDDDAEILAAITKDLRSIHIVCSVAPLDGDDDDDDDDDQFAITKALRSIHIVCGRVGDDDDDDGGGGGAGEGDVDAADQVDVAPN